MERYRCFCSLTFRRHFEARLAPEEKPNASEEKWEREGESAAELSTGRRSAPLRVSEERERTAEGREGGNSGFLSHGGAMFAI